MKPNPTPTTLAVTVMEYGTPDSGGQPEVACVTTEENLSALNRNMLYTECVLIRRDEFNEMLKRLEKL